jgi:hypothetical protein
MKQQALSMVAGKPLDSSSDKQQSTGWEPIMLQQMLASVLVLLPLSGGSAVVSVACDTLRLMAMVLDMHFVFGWEERRMADGTSSPVAEALLPLLMHSVAPAVAAMLQQGQVEQGSTAAAAAVQLAQQQQQQLLLAELGMELGSLAMQIILAGEAGSTLHPGSTDHASSTDHVPA